MWLFKFEGECIEFNYGGGGVLGLGFIELERILMCCYFERKEDYGMICYLCLYIVERFSSKV